MNACFIASGNENGGSGTNPIGTNPQPTSGFSTQTVNTIGTDTVTDSFSFGKISGATYSVDLFATTTSASAVSAKNNQGDTAFKVAPDTIAYITYDATLIEVGGSSATVGNAANFTARTSLANTRTSSSVAPSLRTVGGSPVIVSTSSDAGVTGTLSVQTVQRAAGGDATYTLECAGQADVTAQWFIKATVQVIQLDDVPVLADPAAYFDLSGNIKIHLNLSNNETLDFNL